MSRAFISIGSNINPAENIKRAIGLLAGSTKIVRISTVYRTAPINRPGQPMYYNCVVEIETDCPPVELTTNVLRNIENIIGRIRTDDKYASRKIDLDLILYDDLIVTNEHLTLPDPEIPRRPFLIYGLCELDPELVLPGSIVSLKVASSMVPKIGMEPLMEYTNTLRKELLHADKSGKS